MSTPSTQSAPSRNQVSSVFHEYINGLRGLFTCPRELWFTFLIKVMESLCYFSSVLVLDGVSDPGHGPLGREGRHDLRRILRIHVFFHAVRGLLSQTPLGIKKALIRGAWSSRY